LDNASLKHRNSKRKFSGIGAEEVRVSENGKLSPSVRCVAYKTGSEGNAHSRQKCVTKYHNTNRRTKEKGILTAKSDILRQAAGAVDRLLEAQRTERKGISLKSLTLGKGISNKRAVYAVTVETLKYYKVLEKLIQAVGLDSSAMSPGTCCVLVREIVMGSGVSRIGKAEKIVLEMEGQLKRVLEKMMSDAGVTDVSELLPKNEMEEAANKRRRTLRVNTLKCSVEMAIEALQKTVRIMNLAL
jgi:hypothetical protein